MWGKIGESMDAQLKRCVLNENFPKKKLDPEKLGAHMPCGLIDRVGAVLGH